MRMLRLAVLMMMVFGRLAAQGPVHFGITGTVVDDRNGEPIPFCHMSAFPVVATRGFGQRMGEEGGGFGPRQEQTEADADARGRFTLELKAEGRYRLSASARGFRTQMFEAHGTFSTAVVLTKAAPVHAVVFRASADAVIGGEVTDEAGEAVRNAQVKLYTVGDPDRAVEERRIQVRSIATTDDRGHYELPAMPAGRYEVSVSARPWYATPGPPAQAVNGVVPAALDPSLDVVYPLAWYPGTDDEANAEKIDVKYGERRQLDFRLNPVAAAHLRMTVPVQQLPAGTGAGGPGIGNVIQGVFQRMPLVQRLMPDGSTEPAQTSITNIGQGGQVDIGGLAPGTYRVSQPGGSPDEPQGFSMLHIAAGGGVTEVSAATPEIPVTIRVDGDPTVTAGQVSLIDLGTGQAVGRGGMSVMLGRGGPQGGGRGRRGGEGKPDETTLHVLPGTYQVTVNGRDSFLTGVTATGAQVVGRTVKIVEGSPQLLVHMAAGLASIEGTANRQGKPSSGAMVVLVPATLGDPASLGFERRAQTATDGSFVLTNVIPGQYILVVIDHGWGVNWRDQAALRPYLLEGEPLDLAAAATVHPVVKAVSP